MLAASIAAGRKRLDVELDTIASDPLPAEVIENMPRFAGMSTRIVEIVIPCVKCRSLAEVLANLEGQLSLFRRSNGDVPG